LRKLIGRNNITDVTHFAYQIIFEPVIVRHEAIYFKLCHKQRLWKRSDWRVV